jgi:hypothetical protein
MPCILLETPANMTVWANEVPVLRLVPLRAREVGEDLAAVWLRAHVVLIMSSWHDPNSGLKLMVGSVQVMSC